MANNTLENSIKPFMLNFEAVINMITSSIGNENAEQIKRLYWYEQSHRAIPTQQHQMNSLLPKTKIRLIPDDCHSNSVIGGELIVDMLNLNASVTPAEFIVISDESMLQSCFETIQRTGSTVVLIQINPKESQVRGNFAIADRSEFITIENAADYLVGDAHEELKFEVLQAVNSFINVLTNGQQDQIRIQQLIDDQGKPNIPNDIDKHLLQYASRVIGVYPLDQKTLHKLRTVFVEQFLKLPQND